MFVCFYEVDFLKEISARTKTMSIYYSLCITNYLSLYLFIYLSNFLSMYLSYLSIYPSRVSVSYSTNPSLRRNYTTHIEIKDMVYTDTGFFLSFFCVYHFTFLKHSVLFVFSWQIIFGSAIRKCPTFFYAACLAMPFLSRFCLIFILILYCCKIVLYLENQVWLQN